MKKKIILSIITVILIISLFAISIFIKNIKSQSYTIGKTVTDLNYTELINCNYNYNNLLVNIDIDNSNNDKNISIKIYNPNEVLLDEIEVKKNEITTYSNTLEGVKGDYKIVFNQGNVISSNMFDGGINAIMGDDNKIAEMNGLGMGDMYKKEYKNIKLPNSVTLSLDGVGVKLVPKN